ncbi:RDD family protein [Microbacterium tumbae]
MIWEIHEEEETIEGLDATGRPDPAYASALGMLAAPFGRRTLAAVCDGAFWLLVQLPLWIGAVPLLLKLATGSISPYGFLNHPGFVLAVVMAAITTLFTLVLLIVQLILHGRKGVTIGKAVAGIRTVDVRTLERPGVGRVLLRFLIVAAAGIVPLLGPVLFLISPTFDPERRGRGWHDQATKVWLVDVRRGLHPYDEKRMRVARKVVKAEPAPERSALPSLATPVDPSVQSAYRPGGRLSAGVLGVARPHRAHERPAAGLSQASAPSPVPVEEGKPVLGGYRVPEEQRPPAPQAGLGVPASVPVSVPQRPSATAPIPPAPTAPAPSAVPAQVPVPQAPAPAQAPLPPAAAPAAEPAPHPEPAPAPVQRAEPAARFGLRLDSGDSVLISAPVVLGRNPDAAENPGARPIALADESRSLSKTHLLVRPVDAGLEITDCRSTNGSGLIRDGVEYALAAGTPVLATDGDTIRIGDRTAAVVRV